MKIQYFDLTGFDDIVSAQQVLNWPNYTATPDPSTSLKRVVATYENLSPQLHCRLPSCHRQIHANGCLIELADGTATNWGRNCAEETLGATFRDLRNVTVNSERISRKKRDINRFVQNAESHSEVLDQLLSAERGWEWLGRCRDEFDGRITTNLRAEVASIGLQHGGRISVETRRSQEDIDRLHAQFPQSSRAEFTFESKVVGTLHGVDGYLRFRRDAVSDLKRQLVVLAESAKDSTWTPKMVDERLAWCAEFLSQTKELQRILEAATSFFTFENIAQIHYCAKNSADKSLFEKYGWDTHRSRFVALKKLHKEVA